MPSHEEHCKDSLKKYGKPFGDLHSWMDGPSEILGTQHRMYRHDPYTTPQEAKKIFGEYADHACLDHIILDWRESPERFNSIFKQYPKRGLPAGICPRCGSTLVWRRAQLTGELYRGCTNYSGGCRYQERSYKRTPASLKARRKRNANYYGQPGEIPSYFFDYYDIGLLSPDDSHFYGPPPKVEDLEKAKRKIESKGSPLKEETETVFRHKPPKELLKKVPIAFAILFYLVYSILCLLVIGVTMTALILLMSGLVLVFGLPMGQKRYSRIGGYYWTEPEATLDLAVFVFLFCYLFLTSLFLKDIPFFATAIIFVMGLIATFIIATAIRE